MSVKKTIALVALGAASMVTASYASNHSLASAKENGVYVEGNAGYALMRWKANAPAGTAMTSNGNGGFTGGADVGYQWNKHLALEGGWSYLPKAKATVTSGGSSPTTTNFEYSSWIAFLVAKMSVEVYHNVDLFGKVGVAYRDNEAKSTATVTNHQIRPMFATGVDYFYQNWIANVQYAYVGAGGNSTSNFAPAAHMFTGGVGYLFTL